MVPEKLATLASKLQKHSEQHSKIVPFICKTIPLLFATFWNIPPYFKKTFVGTFWNTFLYLENHSWEHSGILPLIVKNHSGQHCGILLFILKTILGNIPE